ncbi:MAG: hypothetical protein ACRYGL_20305 [Janthinobacterium lividum]
MSSNGKTPEESTLSMRRAFAAMLNVSIRQDGWGQAADAVPLSANRR